MIEGTAAQPNYPKEIRDLAARYIWWMTPDESLAFPRRVIAQVKDLGTFDEYAVVESFFGIEEMKAAPQSANERIRVGQPGPAEPTTGRA